MEEQLQYLDDGSTLLLPQPVGNDPQHEAASNLMHISGWPPVSIVRNTDWSECSCCSPM